jgi:hypothetical protein
MSNNLDIGGLLAKLLNYDEESSESITSTRNLEPVSLSKALNNNQSKEGGNQTLKSANPTKKAIVLQPVAGTPTANSPEQKTSWLESAIAILTGFGATPDQIETMTATYVSNFPEYWVWVLPDSTRNVAVFPAFQGTSTVFNVERFTKCVINDAAIDVELLQGACVRIDYENRNHLGGAYVVNVINNEQDFANAVILELGGTPSAGGGFGACDESGVSVRHPTGDAIGSPSDLKLHNGYKALATAAGNAPYDKKKMYDKLMAGLDNSNLALGIMANAQHESNFDEHVLSGGSESSLGLFQFNVQNKGWIAAPNSAIQARAATALPSSIRIPSSKKVVYYFAGGLLATSKGKTIITPVEYTDQDLSEIYNTVANGDNQIDFAITAAKKMLAEITPASDITAQNWASWWHIYFEQPSAFNSRESTVASIASEIGVTV